MKIQTVEKLPASRDVVTAVRQGNKIAPAGMGLIAGLNLSQGAEAYTFPEAYYIAMTIGQLMEDLRLQAWLKAYSIVPDGLTCWMKDPNPHPRDGVRWNSWLGARHEYTQRANRSRTSPNHIEPLELKLPEIAVDELAYRAEFLAEVYRVRMATLYEGNVYLPGRVLPKYAASPIDKDQPLPSAPIRAVEHEVPVTLKGVAEQRNTTALRLEEDSGVNLPYPPQYRNYTALRLRDAERTNNTRLYFSFKDPDKQARYIEISRAYQVHGIERYAFRGAMAYSGHLGICIGIKPEHRERHTQLVGKLTHHLDNLLNVKGERVEKHAELPPVLVAPNGWMDNLPCGDMLKESSAENIHILLGRDPLLNAEREVPDEPIDRPDTSLAQDQDDEQASALNEQELRAHLQCMDNGTILTRWMQMLQNDQVARRQEISNQAWHSRGQYDDSFQHVLERKAARVLRMTQLLTQRSWHRTMALKVGTMGDGDMEKEVQPQARYQKIEAAYSAQHLMGPPKPTKLEGQYTPPPSEALVKVSKRNTLALLLEEKNIEMMTYVRSVGGPGSFVQDEQTGIYLPPTDFDEYLPSWKGLSRSV